MSYTVRRARLAALMPLAVLPIVLALTAVTDLPAFSPVMVAAVLAIAGFQAYQRSLVLRVDADGVRLGRGIEYELGYQRMMGATVPWSSVRDVVVLSPGPLAGGPAQVGVRLKPGAPLPEGARAVVSDPSRPDEVAPDLRTAVPGGFDRVRLERAVAAHGAGVRVVDAAA